MNQVKEFTCIRCPMGCPLQLTHQGAQVIEVEGFSCNRGAKYAEQEFIDPRRGISTTISVQGGRWGRLPVKVSQPIPKDRVMEVTQIIHDLKVKLPVKRGQILLKNILDDPGSDVVVCRSMGKKAR